MEFPGPFDARMNTPVASLVGVAGVTAQDDHGYPTMRFLSCCRFKNFVRNALLKQKEIYSREVLKMNKVSEKNADKPIGKKSY